MSAHALLLALALTAMDTPPAPPPAGGEPLPPGAPTEDYPLAAWCYGAMSEYLEVYDRIKPDLRAIDKMFGTSQPNEAQPYADDMSAARDELKVLADAVESAEKASPGPIAPKGVEAIKQGRSIWSLAESKTSRELARAWLSWAMPDRCDSTARSLAAKSALLGQALKYNTVPSADTSASPAPTTPPSISQGEKPAIKSATPAEAPSSGSTPAPVPAPATTPAPPPVTQDPPSSKTSVATPAEPAKPKAEIATTSQVTATESPPPAATAGATPPLPANTPTVGAPAEPAQSPPPRPAPFQLPDPNGPVPDAVPQGGAPQS